jgi:glycosyltransferase involved in cell wall biosynthesis
MEIVHIVLGKANPNRMNGVNKVVYQLATYQFNAGVNVSVWGITKETTANYGQRNFVTRLYKAHSNPFKVDARLAKAIEAKPKDTIFHVHGGWIPVFSSLSALFEKNGLQFVFTPHGAYNTIAMKRSFLTKRIYFNLFEKPMLKRASKIHCIGQSEVDGLNKIFQSNKTCLLPYGYEVHSVKQEHLYEKGNELIVGFVGRLDMYTKGLDLLLNAFEDFSKKHINSKLWIIGDGSDRKKFEQEVKRKNLSHKVVLFGGVFGKEKDMLISKMHVFAHPSRNEGLPSSVLEASSLGIPCLISKETNVADKVESYQSGLVLKNNDSQNISSALERFYDLWLSDKLKGLSKNAQLMVSTEFNWTKILRDFGTLYQA